MTIRKAVLSSLTTLALATSGYSLADYPSKGIQGIIMWGAGGSTDSVMRSVTPYAEEKLGVDVIMTNRSGGVGAIATKYVYSQKSDGYTLLMGAENPQMHKVLGLSPIDYSDMIPINILARGTPVIVANNDAPFDTFAEFVDYAKAHPGAVKTGMTGNGGLTSIVLAMLDSQVKLDLTRVPYNGDGPALTALQSGTIDVMSSVLGAALDHIQAGRMKVISVIDSKENDLVAGVAPVTDTYPELSSYLPWGPFFGIFVKQGTPQAAVDKLVEAYHHAAQTEAFQKLMAERGFEVMNQSGDEAKAFLERYRSVSSWIVYDSGFAKKSPEEFDIPRP